MGIEHVMLEYQLHKLLGIPRGHIWNEPFVVTFGDLVDRVTSLHRSGTWTPDDDRVVSQDSVWAVIRSEVEKIVAPHQPKLSLETKINEVLCGF